MNSPTPSPWLRYRATLDDGDLTRERPMTIYGNSLEEIRQWAAAVLPKALDGGAVNVYATLEQHVEMIPKPKAKA